MLKGKRDNFLLIGLSEMNMSLLKKDKPIKFNLQAVGFTEDIEVLIFGGTDEQDLLRQAQPLMTEDTVIVDNSKAKKN